MKSFAKVKLLVVFVCLIQANELLAQWNEPAPLGANQTITRSGNIGLGIANPDAKIHINIPLSTNGLKITSPEGNFNFTGHALSLYSHATWNQVPYLQWVAPNGLRQAYFGWQKDYLNLTLENGYNFSINGGNVGIANSDPQAKLHITSSERIAFKINHPSSTTNYLSVWHGTGGAVIDPIGTGYLFLGYETPSTILLASGGGMVGIGTSNPDPAYRLSVNGSIRAKEIKVNTGWSDFVFFDSYKLRPLSEVETFIQENKHLPDVPSAAVVEKEGVNLGEMDAILLRKIEELTLYVIEQDKIIKEQNKRLQKLELENQKLSESK
jgi:hypothetical protein